MVWEAIAVSTLIFEPLSARLAPSAVLIRGVRVTAGDVLVVEPLCANAPETLMSTEKRRRDGFIELFCQCLFDHIGCQFAVGLARDLGLQSFHNHAHIFGA